MVSVEVAHRGCNFRPYQALLVSERQHEIVNKLMQHSDQIGSTGADLYGHVYANSPSFAGSPSVTTVRTAEERLLPLLSESGERVSEASRKRALLLNEIARSSGSFKASMHQAYTVRKLTPLPLPEITESLKAIIDDKSLLAAMEKMVLEVRARNHGSPPEYRAGSEPAFSSHADAVAHLSKLADTFKAEAFDAAEERRNGTGAALRFHFAEEKMVKHVYAVMDDVDRHVYQYAKALANVQDHIDVDIDVAYRNAGVPAHSARAAYSRAEELRIGLDAEIFKMDHAEALKHSQSQNKISDIPVNLSPPPVRGDLTGGEP